MGKAYSCQCAANIEMVKKAVECAKLKFELDIDVPDFVNNDQDEEGGIVATIVIAECDVLGDALSYIDGFIDGHQNKIIK